MFPVVVSEVVFLARYNQFLEVVFGVAVIRFFEVMLHVDVFSF